MNVHNQAYDHEDDRFTKAATQLMGLTKMNLIAAQMANAFLVRGRKSIEDKSAGADSAALAQTLAAFEVEFNKETPDLVAGIVDLYRKAYTLDDLEQILAFYTSAVGQKLLQGGAVFEQGLQPVAQAWAQEAGRTAFQRAIAKVNDGAGN